MSSHIRSPRRTTRSVFAAAIAVAVAFAGQIVLISPAAAADPAWRSSFETSDAAPSTSTSFLPPTNVTGKRYANGSHLPLVTAVTHSAENAPGEAAINVSDADQATKWLAFANTGWVGYELSSPRVVAAYTLQAADDAPERDPRNFTLEGSTDGTTWTPLDSREGETFSTRFATNTYTTGNTTAYSHYRLNITANQSGNIIQLAGWDILDGTDNAAPATPMVTAVGNGPTNGPTSKSGVGFTGTKALQYSGAHIADGAASATNLVYDVDITVTGATELSYKIFPLLTTDLQYPATYAAVDLLFTDGTRSSAGNLVDYYGFPADARGQGESKVLFGNQWNSVRVDLGSFAGKTVDRVLLSYDNPSGAASTTFSGWIDDISLTTATSIAPTEGLVSYVDTRRGTNSNGSYSRGNNIPATAWPNGFNFFTPATDAGIGGNLYQYHRQNNSANNPTLQGIQISHQPSPWMGDRNQLSVMPSASANPTSSLTGRALEFSHDNEIARPDLYSVLFTNQVVAEVTATDHGGVYRFQFPGDTGSVLVDRVSGDSRLTAAADGTVTGWVDNGDGDGRSRMFVYGEFDRTPTAAGATTAGNRTASAQYAAFDTSSNSIVELRIATSFISLDQAAHSFALEVEGRSFESVRVAARDAWNDRLSVIEVEDAPESQLVTLYSNLYRLNLYPNSQFENVGSAASPQYRYASPVSPKVGAATDTTTNAQVLDGKIYVNNGFWDTYRTVWPLYSLLYPELAEELVDGFVEQYRAGGWVARWSSPGYANMMTGTSSDVSFAEAYMAGALGNDLALEAYDAAVKNATVVATDNATGRKGIDTSIFLGYTAESTHESVSWGLEGFINDFGIGTMAAKLAEDPETPANRVDELIEEAKYFLDRSQNYVNMHNPEFDFFTARRADGVFPQTSFDPKAWWGAYTETNGWNFAFHAPFDVEGLAAMYGGQDALLAKLDEFYATVEVGGGTIHEMLEARDVRMGQLGMSNQVSHHIPYLYAAAGRPSGTQEDVREILDRLFVGSDIGQGYLGDEDNGEMSSWYILSALGFYPLEVGSGDYTIGSPLFSKATVHLPTHDLVIEAPGNAMNTPYVASVSLDGTELASASLPGDALRSASTLTFEMSATPTAWGERTFEAEAPKAMVDATKAGYGSTVTSDGIDAGPLVDDNSRSSVAFTSANPTITWTSASGPVVVDGYTITSATTETAPAAWTLEGSSDGATWVGLDQRAGQLFADGIRTRPFQIGAEAAASFSYYRLTVDATATAGTNPVIAELELFANPGASTDFAVTGATGIVGAPGVELNATLATVSGGTSRNAADYEVVVDFFDGQGPVSATVTENALGGWGVTIPHIFAEPGEYTARVTASEVGTTNQASALVTISIRRDDSLVGAFDSNCIGDAGTGANCDDRNWAYDRAKLAADGFVQGTTIAVPDTALTFDLPAIAAGEPDNATGAGQRIMLDLGEGATQVSVIGTATQADLQTTGVLTYRDGTTEEISISYGDWVGSVNAPRFGSILVGTSAGRLEGSAGGDNQSAGIFASAPHALLTGHGAVVSLTLPTQTGDPGTEGRIHVFAIASDGVRTPIEPLSAAPATVGTQLTGVEFEATLATASGGSGIRTASINWGDLTAVQTGVAVAGDGTVSGVHTYAAAGEYQVSITVDDGTSSTSTTTTIRVESPVVYAPSLAVDPGAVAPGATVGFSGDGYAAGESVDVTLATSTAVVSSVTATMDGTISGSFVVPVGTADGSYPVTSLGAVSATTATSTIVVETRVIATPEIELSAVSARQGESVSITGRAFAPGETVTFSLHSTPMALGSTVVSGDGTFAFSMLVPIDAPVGDHGVRAVASSTPGEFVLAFTVLARDRPDQGTTPVDTGPWTGLPDTGLASTGVDASGRFTAAIALLALGMVFVTTSLVVRLRSRRGSQFG